MEAKPLKEILLRWLLACGGFALLLYFFSPPWAAFRAWHRTPELGHMVEVRRGVSVLQQMEHIGAPVADTLHGAIQWRLLFPVIGRVLHLPPALLFALAPLGCVAVLGFIITVLRRRGTAWPEAALVAVMLGAGSWYFASVCWLGYFDSWLVLAMLIVAFARAPWAIWLACLWAPWVDERFVLAAPLALFCRYFATERGAPPPPLLEFLKKQCAAPAALLAAFVLVRLGVLAGVSAPRATVGGYLGSLDVLHVSWERTVEGIWQGLRAGWLLVALAGWQAGRRSRLQALVLAIVLAGVMAVGLATAQDFSRSMMLVLPVGLLGAIGALAAAPRWLPLVLRIGAAAALLLPGALVMNDGVNPVSGLYHELASLRSPPAAIMPELYELRAIRAMELGKFDQAEKDLTLAIALAQNPAGPAKQRGVLYASAGRWAQARQDFDLMVKHAPENPDAWFLRAQSELALGDTAAARSDWQQAQAVADQDWLSRPDVGRFRTRLGQAK